MEKSELKSNLLVRLVTTLERAAAARQLSARARDTRSSLKPAR
jgi:hypothetical protein